MNNRIWYSPLGRAIVLSLVFSAALATPVFADDEVPPAEVAETTSTPITDAPASESSATEEPVAGRSTAAEPVVLDEGSETMPLATEQAAELAVLGDPMWCPAGVTPGGAPCSPSGNTSFADLIAWLDTNNPDVAGVIWIERSYDSSTAVGDDLSDGFTLNGDNYGLMPSFSLTIKGGWTGAGTVIDTADPSLFTYDSLSIINWTGAVTISDITITGAFTNPDGAVIFSHYPGLYVQTDGNISLARVESSNNADGGPSMMGAFLDNCKDLGAGCTGAGSVTITDSRFKANDNEGLVIYSTGAVTLKNVGANKNTNWDGVHINNTFAALPRPVTITNGEFKGNGDEGLSVLSNGALTLANITAVDNGQNGAELGTILLPAAASVYVNGVNNFSSNGYDGLYVVSAGAINVSWTTANDNGIRGAFLDNSGAPLPQNVSILGYLSAIGNIESGLVIRSQGAISAANLTAIGNGSFGARIRNDYALDGASRPVNLTGTNVFNKNTSTGLAIESDGAVTLSNVSALSNNGRGVLVEVYDGTALQQNVTLLGPSLFYDNFFGGLIIYTNGAVSLGNVNASSNGRSTLSGDGVYIDNDAGTLARPVTIAGTNVFNDNLVRGLYVTSNGAVTLNNITAIANGGRGVSIENDILGTVAAPVKVNGVNNFSLNALDGLYVQSDGAISLSRATANGNGTRGVNISNDAPPSPQGITLLGYVTAVGNGTNGINIASDGAVLGAILTAADNGSIGAYIINSNVTLPKPVTLTGVNAFDGNTGVGLWIESKGAIAIHSLAATYNTGVDGGVQLRNDWGAPGLAQNVTLIGPSLFHGNAYTGLAVITYGAVSMANVSASSNGASSLFGDGVSIYNAGATISPAVTIAGTNVFNGNWETGLLITSNGAVTLNNVTALRNGDWGAFVDNDNLGLAAAHVKVNGVNTFSHNGVHGLLVDSAGAISLSKTTANGNFARGLYLSNDFAPTSPQNVSILGYLTAVGNGSKGMHISSFGAVSVANLTADRNEAVGVVIDNSSGTVLPKPVVLSGTNAFNNNGGQGLWILSKGAVTLSNITATWNGYDPNLVPLGDYIGVHINNRVAATVQQNVTLLGVNVFSHNARDGLKIESYGDVTLNNLTANFNGNGVNADFDGSGIWVDNHGGLLAKAVLLNGVNAASSNDSFGLAIYSSGAITVSRATISDNDNDGAYLYNKYGTFQSGITITGFGVFERNGYSGLAAQSNGSLTASNLTANYNSSHGAALNTQGITAPQVVTLTGTNIFTFNGSGGADAGLQVTSDGSIAVNNVIATNNFYRGALLDNYTNWIAGPSGSVALTGFGYFTANLHGEGLFVYSKGNVVLNRASSDLNGDDGFDNGITIYAGGNVTLVCSSAYGNVGSGLQVRNTAGGAYAGILTLKGFHASFNNPGWDEDFGATIPVRTACP